MSRCLYSLVWWLATPWLLLALWWRGRHQPGYRRAILERWGFAPPRRDDAPLIWVHAVSVGETRAVEPLIAALLARHPAARLLLTSMTATGRETGEALFARRYPGRVAQAWLPYDGPLAVRRFLRRWRPSLGLLVETELWPNLCAGAARARVPLVLVNARLSERSLRKGLRWRALIVPALRSLHGVIAQTSGDAQRIRCLADVAVEVVGNLKFDVHPSEALLARGQTWRGQVGDRPVVLAASTRDGEEALLLDAWRVRRSVAQGVPPLLVLVPRHPERFEAVADAVRARGLSLRRRADLDRPQRFGADVTVLLGDSMGEMFAWYAMADAAIIGGTLLPFGGQNLIEACAVGVPVVIGGSTFNFEQAADAAIEAGAAIRVADAEAAIDTALRLATASDGRAGAVALARGFSADHRGATERTIALLAPLLPPESR